MNCTHKFKYTTYNFVHVDKIDATNVFYIKWGVVMEVIVEYTGTLNRELVQLDSGTLNRELVK